MADSQYDVYKKSSEYVPATSEMDSTVWQDIASNYKDVFLNVHHDKSQMSLILPDDCLVLIGPARVNDLNSGSTSLYPVGYLQGFSYSETRTVQPLKTIGSRRHIFAATNAPIQGQIQRMLLLHDNLMHALYNNKRVELKNNVTTNPHYSVSAATINEDSEEAYHDWWFTNAEEDIFRIPFGMAVIYNAPYSRGTQGQAQPAEYIESCVLTGKQMQLQSGQAMIMESVSFMADRVMPFVGWNKNSSSSGTTALLTSGNYT